jgi:diguanylate cyclase (GGDEF)-like protein
MGPLRQHAKRLWAWLLAPPDEILADAARDGETLVARIRTWLSLLILLIPVLSMAMDPGPQHWVGLAVALAAVIFALGLDQAVRSGLYSPQLSVMTSLADVTFVSCCLLGFWFIDQPIVTTNSRVVFEAYFLVIGASALRYSPRATAVAGVGAMAQYLLLSWLTWRLHSPADLAMQGAAYGAFDAPSQVSRTVMLFGMTVIALAVVNRTTRLRRLSTFDRLTGLFNRAYVEGYLSHELARALRERRPFVVAMLDVDHFKAFNDTHGHAAGDAALRQLADTLRTTLRRSDVVARFGGEEILVAMQGTELDAAMEKLDDVRIRIGLGEVELPRGGVARFTVSIGVATLGADGTRLDELLDVADKRMYHAKEAGRNRVFGPER